MCLFKRKKKKDLKLHLAKYKMGDYVNFRYRDELYFGYIYTTYVDENDKVTYTIQIAGQCPSFIKGYKEEDIIGLKKD